jgi:hypothetical protein
MRVHVDRARSRKYGAVTGRRQLVGCDAGDPRAGAAGSLKLPAAVLTIIDKQPHNRSEYPLEKQVAFANLAAESPATNGRGRGTLALDRVSRIEECSRETRPPP